MKYEDKLLDHDYDGIQELDNRLPPWWLNLFYITIIWGVLYFVYYHMIDMGPGQEEEYALETGQVVEKSSFEIPGYRSPFADKPGMTSEQPVKSTDAAETAMTEEPTAEMEAVNYEPITDAGRLENGKAVYVTNCVACHGNNGEGNIGPNLTDNYWINGDGSYNEIVKVVQYGVPVKGMIAWKPLLKESDLQDVSSHVLGLIGTNPANGKAPQGEQYGE